jgi:hypothetical protein
MSLENYFVVNNYVLRAVVMQITSPKSVIMYCQIGLSDMCNSSSRKSVI